MTIGQPEVELGEGRPRVVRARDRAEVTRQLGIPGSQERHKRVVRRRMHPIFLLHIVIDLLVVCQEEERPVPLERSAEREPELVLGEVGFEFFDGAARERVLGSAGDGVELAEIVERSFEIVRPGLGDHVHKTAGRAPELGVGAARDHHELLHGIEVEGKRRPLAAALLAKERVVEVRTVHRHVVVNAALARHGQLVAVWTLHDGHVRREQRQVEVVASVVRQARHHLRRQRRGRHGLGHVYHRLPGFHRDRRQRHRREREPQGHRFAHPQRDSGLFDLREAHRPRRRVIGAEREQRAGEVARRVRRERAREVCLRLVQDDLRVGHRIAARIRDHAADDAGGGLRLGAEHRGSSEQGEGRADQHGRPAREGADAARHGLGSPGGGAQGRG